MAFGRLEEVVELLRVKLLQRKKDQNTPLPTKSGRHPETFKNPHTRIYISNLSSVDTTS